MPTDRQEDTLEKRMECIEQFLTSPHGVRFARPTVGQGFWFDGVHFYTKDPKDVKKGLDNARVGVWKDGRPHLYNTKRPLGKDTLRRAKEKGIDVVIVS